MRTPPCPPRFSISCWDLAQVDFHSDLDNLHSHRAISETKQGGFRGGGTQRGWGSPGLGPGNLCAVSAHHMGSTVLSLVKKGAGKFAR